MSTAEPASASPSRPSRRRPFTNWVKRITSFKYNSSSPHSNRRSGKSQPQQSDNHAIQPTNSEPILPDASGSVQMPYSDYNADNNTQRISTRPSITSMDTGNDTHFSTKAIKSAAPTLDIPIDASSGRARSQNETVNTAAALSGLEVDGKDSTFSSSPAHSNHSLNTTFTTLQQIEQPAAPTQNDTHSSAGETPRIQTSSSGHTIDYQALPMVASAIPAHVTGGQAAPTAHGPATYAALTANNQLADNASILTIASSTQRRRRNSMDTNASVKALAPSSMFGGSRESLPISVLSGEHTGLGTQSLRPGAAVDRTSFYSISGGGPATDRNSYYANKHTYVGDAGSVRSGRLGHARNDSTTGSIAASSMLGNIRDVNAMPGPSRTDSRQNADERSLIERPAVQAA